MTVVVCIIGALVGVAVALGARSWALPYVLRSQQAHTQNGKLTSPAAGFPRDAQLARQVTIFVYRYVFPVVFAVVFAFAAYEIYNGGSR